MAIVTFTDAWGTGFNMSGYGADGWGVLPAIRMFPPPERGRFTDYLYLGAGDNYDGVSVNFSMATDDMWSPMTILAVRYYVGGTQVGGLTGLNFEATASELNATPGGRGAGS